MKKNLLGFASLALILASCSKNEVVDNVNQSQQTPIVFAPITGSVTSKALEVNSTKLKSIPIIPLYAYKTEDGTTEEYFTEKLNWGSDKWTTATQRFFPKTGDLTFYSFFGFIDNGAAQSAVSVADFNYSDIDKTTPTITYTIADKADDQADVMVAKLSMTTPISGNANKTVVLPFKHILSQINFGVKGYTGATIKISNIKINAGLANTNTYSLSGEAWMGEPTGAAEAYEYMTTENHLTNGNDGDITYIFGDGGTEAAGNTNISYVYKANSNSLILMPQLLFNKAFTFDYEIMDLTGVIVASETGAVAPLFNNAVLSWNPNLRYVYIIDFTPWLDDRKLDFDVDIISYPWENYDWNEIPGDGNGIVTVPAGMTSFGGTLSENVIWDFTSRFTSWSKGSIYKMDLSTVNFGSKTITITFNNADVTVEATAAQSVTITSGQIVVSGPTNLTFSRQ